MAKFDNQVKDNFVKLVEQGKSKEDIIQELGISERTYYYWKKAIKINIQTPPKSHRHIEELVNHKKEMFLYREKEEFYYDNIKVTLPNEPFGLLLMGDPHLDNIGTDLSHFEKDLDIARNNDSIYVVGLGDYIDNWVGYLNKLYIKHSIIEEEIYELVKHYFSEINWLGLITGNHDNFNNIFTYYLKEVVGEDTPINEFLRFTIQFTGVCDEITAHFRHNFKGNSQYNPAFGLVKQAIFNKRDDIIAQGHWHSSAYTAFPNAEGFVSHCIQVGSYKKIDKFGKQVSLYDTNVFPSCLCVINPSLSKYSSDRIKVFFDVEEGSKYLSFLRSF